MKNGIVRQLTNYRVVVVGYTLFVVGGILLALPEFVAFSGADVLQVFGAALVPTGLISLINEHFLRRSVIDEVTEKFEGFLADHMDTLFERRGNTADLFQECPTQDIALSLSGARKEVVLLNNWIPNFDGLHRGIRDALSRGARVRILMMNPKSPYIEKRGRELGLEDPWLLGSYIDLDLASMNDFFRDSRGAGSVEVRLFDEMPPIPVYASEDEMYIGWFFKGKRAVTCPVVKIRGNASPLFKEIMATFEWLWDRHSTKEYLSSGR